MSSSGVSEERSTSTIRFACELAGAGSSAAGNATGSNANASAATASTAAGSTSPTTLTISPRANE